MRKLMRGIISKFPNYRELSLLPQATRITKPPSKSLFLRLVFNARTYFTLFLHICRWWRELQMETQPPSSGQ